MFVDKMKTISAIMIASVPMFPLFGREKNPFDVQARKQNHLEAAVVAFRLGAFVCFSFTVFRMLEAEPDFIQMLSIFVLLIQRDRYFGKASAIANRSSHQICKVIESGTNSFAKTDSRNDSSRRQFTAGDRSEK